MSIKKELILCFNKKQALSLMKDTSGDAEEFLKHSHHLDQYFIPRYVAETSDTLVHPIPYFAVVNESNEVLLYQRGSSVGENRLAGSYSIAFGGHTELVKDGIFLGSLESTNNIIFNAMAHEMNEEVVSECAGDFNLLDMIYDDSNEVGKVHLGVGAFVRVNTACTNEKELVDCGFNSKDKILEMHNNGEITLENWSLLLLDML